MPPQSDHIYTFGELYSRYYHLMRRFLLHQVGQDTVEDLLQDVFVKAYQGLQRMLGAPRCFRAWLFRITLNTVTDQRRHVALISWLPWKEGGELEGEACLLVDGPEQEVEDADLLRRLFLQVPSKYRPCLYFDIIEPMKHQAIADLLGISDRTVRSRLAEGRKCLREAYMREMRKTGT